MTTGKLCFCTLVTPGFVLGGAVTLHSFLAQNPWFEGDLIVLAEDLGEDDVQRLKVDPRVQVRPVPADLSAAVADAVAQRPALEATARRFYCCAALDLTGYDRVLFCDADLLFLDSVAPVFQQDLVLGACLDGFGLRGEARDSVTFMAQADGAAMLRTFNSGFMVFDMARLPDGAWHQVLATIAQFGDGTITAGHRDQVVFNRIFQGAWTDLGSRYNYLIGHHQAAARATGGGPMDAAVLHFNGPLKPWDAAQAMHLAQDPAVRPAVRAWMQAKAAAEHTARAAAGDDTKETTR